MREHHTAVIRSDRHIARRRITNCSFLPAPLQSISGEARIRIARVRNAILLLSQYSIPIGPDTIMDVYNASIRHDIQPKDMQHPNNATPLCEDIVGRLKSRRGAAAE